LALFIIIYNYCGAGDTLCSKFNIKQKVKYIPALFRPFFFNLLFNQTSRLRASSTTDWQIECVARLLK